MSLNIPTTKFKRIVIIGGGFAGITLVKSLKNNQVQVILIDRNNYHTFQPLLYQVATGGLEADSIAYPLRKIVSEGHNLYYRMAEVLRIVPDKNEIETSIGMINYDYLVIATGSQANYFNFEPIKDQLFSLKTIPQALDLRSYLLQNLESALLASRKEDQEEILNVVIVGGGATGVELAGALIEMKNYILPKDYPEINFDQMHIFLFEAEDKLLGSMSKEASKKTMEYLTKMGVKVILNAMVKSYNGTYITYGEDLTIKTDTFIWTAGVKGAAIQGLEKALTPNNRFKTNSYFQIEGFDNIYAIGDIAAVIDENHPKGYPMVAQVAIQQAKILAKNILNQQKDLKPISFLYRNKGSMATVGKNKAVVDLPKFKFQGAFAWYVWMFIHLLSLAGFRNKLVTLGDWFWNYISYDRALRLIIRPFHRKTDTPFES